jgi:hypothetical protein
VPLRQVRFACSGLVERRGAAERDLDVVALRPQNALNRSGDHRVVVHDQDPAGRRTHDPYILPELSKDAVRPGADLVDIDWST